MVLWWLLETTVCVGVLAAVVTLVCRVGRCSPVVRHALWLVVLVAGGYLYPALVQSLVVNPNQQSRELPYIERNVDATRRAWGLDRIDAVSHPADPMVTAAPKPAEAPVTSARAPISPRSILVRLAAKFADLGRFEAETET